jgi:hypothetical protein
LTVVSMFAVKKSRGPVLSGLFPQEYTINIKTDAPIIVTDLIF